MSQLTKSLRESVTRANETRDRFNNLLAELERNHNEMHKTLDAMDEAVGEMRIQIEEIDDGIGILMEVLTD